MYNKRVLSTAVSELGKAKKPSKKRDNVITAKRQQTPIVTTQGFKQGPPPLGSKYRIPGDTLYNPTPYPIEAVSDNGIRKTLNPFDTSNIKFPGANYVDEYEKKEEGGEYYDDELTQEEIDDLIAQGYIVEDLPKAQLGKGTTVEVSPFSLNANQSQLASNVYGEYDPEFLIGARTPLGGSRDPRFSTDLGLTLGVPYSGSMIPSVNADWRWRYRPSAVSAGAFAPTVQTDITLGWDPTQGFNHKMVASPRWEFGNRMLGVYRQPRWPVGAWKGYAGPAAGWEFRQHSFVPGLEGYQNTGEHRTGNFNFDYGAVAGIEGRPFKSTPLRVGADASLMFQPGKGQAEEQFNPDTDFNSVKWGMTPMLKVKAVYPIGANLSKKKEAEEEKIKIDAARANDKNFIVTAPTITGPGVDWGYEEKPESTGIPVGNLPGYEPETGRQLTEEEVMQRYGQGPRLAKGGSLLTKKVTCKDCGWKWNAADGGNDVTTCHKCGGQGLLHVQKGGLPKAQFGMFDKWKKKNVDQVIADAEPQEGVQQLMEVEASGDEAKKKLHISLMDKARALGRTVAGRKVWMEDGPRNWTFDELQEYVNKVNDYNKQAQRYERDKRLVEKGELDTDTYAQRYNEGNWARFDQATKKESFKGQYQNAVDEGMARKEKNFAVTQGLAELTGVPAAMRIVSDPVGTLKGVGTSLADLAMLPYAAWQAKDWADNTLNMNGTWNLSENPITGQNFGAGFNKTIDVASVLPILNLARPAVKAVTSELNLMKSINKVPSSKVLLQSAEQRLGNPKAYNLLQGTETGLRGKIANKYYSNAQKSLAVEENKILDEIYKLRQAGNDELADQLALQNEKLWEKSLQLDKEYGNWRRQYSGLPIEETGMGGGEGRIYSLTGDPNQVVKVGHSFNTEDELAKLVDVGQNFNSPGTRIAFPTKVVSLKGDKQFAQFMPKLNYERSLPLTKSMDDLVTVANDLNAQGVGLDYRGIGNIGGVGDDLGLVDLTYIGKPGQRTNAFVQNPSIFDPSKSKYGFKLQENLGTEGQQIADNAAGLLNGVTSGGLRNGGVAPMAQFGFGMGKLRKRKVGKQKGEETPAFGQPLPTDPQGAPYAFVGERPACPEGEVWDENLQSCVLPGIVEQPTMYVSANPETNKKRIKFIDKANALWDTIEGRKVWMENGPKNYSLNELSKFVHNVKDYKDQAAVYEKYRRMAEDDEISGDEFARLYNENNWIRFDQNTGRENFKGQWRKAAQEGIKKKAENAKSVASDIGDILHTAGEYTGINSVGRVIANPIETLSDTGQTIVDIGMTAPEVPYMAYDYLSNLFTPWNREYGNEYSGTEDINPLTGQPYWSGSQGAIDLITSFPFFKSAAAGLMNRVQSQGLTSQGLVGDAVSGTTQDVRLVQNAERSEQLGADAYDVYRGNQRVGEVSGNKTSRGDFEVTDIGVDPQFQKQGIGQEIYKQLNQSLPEGNRVKSWGAFVETNGVKPGEKTWQALEREGLAVKNDKGVYEMVPAKQTSTEIGAGSQADNIIEGTDGTYRNFTPEQEARYNKAIEHFNKHMFLPESKSLQGRELLDDFISRINSKEGLKRLGELGINDPKYFEDLVLKEIQHELGYFTEVGGQPMIALHTGMPAEIAKNITRHEIEHAVQRAIIKSGQQPFSEIDYMLNGLTLKGTPNVSVPREMTWNAIEFPKNAELFPDLQKNLDYYAFGSGGKEKSAFLAEVQQGMLDNGIIDDVYENITPEKVKKAYKQFIEDPNPDKYTYRFFEIMEPTEANFELTSKALNKMLAIPGAIGGVGTAGYMMNQGATEQPVEGLKKGGAVSKKYSRSLEAKNQLYTENRLVKKRKPKNKKIFSPTSPYFKMGGIPDLPLNENRQVLRDWTYGESIGMLQEEDGGIIHAQAGLNLQGVRTAPVTTKAEPKKEVPVRTVPVPAATQMNLQGIRTAPVVTRQEPKKEYVKPKPQKLSGFDMMHEIHNMYNNKIASAKDLRPKSKEEQRRETSPLEVFTGTNNLFKSYTTADRQEQTESPLDMFGHVNDAFNEAANKRSNRVPGRQGSPLDMFGFPEYGNQGYQPYEFPLAPGFSADPTRGTTGQPVENNPLAFLTNTGILGQIDHAKLARDIEREQNRPKYKNRNVEPDSWWDNTVDALGDAGEFILDTGVDAVNTLGEWKNMGKRYLQKEGWLDIEEEKIDPNKAKKLQPKIKQTPKVEKFYQEIAAVDDAGYSDNKLLSYRNQWDNNEGFVYIATPTLKDRTGKEEYRNVRGVGHFLLDASAVPGKEYKHEYNEAYLKKAMKNNDWIPTFTPVSGNKVKLKYKKPDEITKEDKVVTPLRQFKFDNLAFDKTQRPEGFQAGIKEVKTKDGQGSYLIFKDRNGYSRFSGGSVVFIFKDKYGNTIVRDFAGTLNNIENEGLGIKKTYGLKDGDLTIGYHDVGSFSAKPKADESGVLKSSQWGDFNPGSMTGGALLIPNQ